MGRKFYCCEFVNKHYPTPEGYVFLKFGHTHHYNVMDRFNPDVDDGYPKNYDDWEITPKFSWYFKENNRAEEEEQMWLNIQYPRSKYKVWVENVLKVEDNTKYSNNTGITELRYMTREEASRAMKKLYERRERFFDESGTA